MTGYFSLGGSLFKAKAETVATLNRIAGHHQRSLAQVMLCWSIQKGVSVIPGHPLILPLPRMPRPVILDFAGDCPCLRRRLALTRGGAQGLATRSI